MDDMAGLLVRQIIHINMDDMARWRPCHIIHINMDDLAGQQPRHIIHINTDDLAGGLACQPGSILGDLHPTGGTPPRWVMCEKAVPV